MNLSTLPYQFLANFKNHIGTYLIIILNVISFGFQDHSFNVSSLLSEGANFAPYSLTNQPYRLISSVFLHGGFIHLIINLYNLYFVGKTVEEKVGVIQFLHLYFFYGITASIASCQFNLFTISVGASGAIFGSYAFLFLKEWNESNTQRKSLLINFIIFAFINTIFIRHLNIDVYAHLGGTLAGACSFILLQVFQKSTTSLLLWVLPIGLYFFIPNTQPQYYSAYNYTIQKDDHIRSALNSYYLDNDEHTAKIKVIKDLPDSIAIQFATIKNLPKALQLDTAIILDFFRLRKKQIFYFLMLFENDSFLYEDSILFIRDQLAQSARPHYALDFNYKSNENSVNINNQGLKQEREYYDKNWDTTPYVYKAEYYRIGTKDSLGNWHGKIIDYYADDTPQMRGTYHRDLKQGIFIYYNEDGTVSSAGCYENDQRIGKWEYYYSNNMLSSEIRYINNFSYIENIYDSLGQQLVKDGKGIDIDYHPNGAIAVKRTIEGGLNHGVYEGYYENGDPYFIEYHKKGFLDYGISYDSLGNVYRYEEHTIWPYPTGGYEKLVAYFEANNQMKSDDFDDYVELKFRVRKNGSIHEIVVTKSIHPTLDKHAEHLLINGPSWQPAKIHGFEIVERSAIVRVMF